MVRKVIVHDDISNYYTVRLTTPKLVKHAVARTYVKNWSLVAGVDGRDIVIGSDGVNWRDLPYPEISFRDFHVKKVDVSSKGNILIITFS